MRFGLGNLQMTAAHFIFKYDGTEYFWVENMQLAGSDVIKHMP